MKRNFNRDNCVQRMRAVITDCFGNKIVLSGRYAFEWTITTYKEDGIQRMTFSTGKEARQKFNELKKKR